MDKKSKSFFKREEMSNLKGKQILFFLLCFCSLLFWLIVRSTQSRQSASILTQYNNKNNCVRVNFFFAADKSCLVMAIFFTLQHTVWKSIWYVLCPVSSLFKAKSFFFKEPSSDSTSQGENGVVAYSNSNTGDICAYFKKRNVSDERKYSLVVSLRTQIRKN